MRHLAYPSTPTTFAIPAMRLCAWSCQDRKEGKQSKLLSNTVNHAFEVAGRNTM